MYIIDRRGGLGGLIRSGRSIVLLSILVVTVIAATAGFTIWHSRGSTLDAHRRSMTSMGVVLAEQTSRFAQVIDLLVQAEQSGITRRNLATQEDFRSLLSTREMHAHLAEALKNVPQADAIVVVDANGVLVNGSRAWPAVPVDLSDRDYYKYFSEQDDSSLFVGSLSKSRGTGALSLFFARRISGPKGIFLGLVVALVDIKSLEAFYQKAGEHVKHAVTLLRRDGTMLIRYPNPQAAVGVKLPVTSPWHSLMAAGGGSYRTIGALDGEQTLVTVCPLPDYPLVVDVVMKEADVFAEWRVEAVLTTIFASVAALTFLVLFRMLYRQFKRQAEQNAELESASARLHEGQEISRAYAEMSADWFWEQDADLRFTTSPNAPFRTASDDIGKLRWEVSDPAMPAQRWNEHKADLAARRPFRNFHWKRIGPDGRRYFISTSGNPIFDRNGVFRGYRGTGRDITAEVAANARLAQMNFELELGRQRFHAVLSNISLGVGFFDAGQRLLLCNRRYTEIYRLPPEATCVGRSLAEIVDYRYKAGSFPDMSQAEYLAWQDQIIAVAKPFNTIVTLRDGRGIAIRHQPMPEGGWVATHEDITERQEAEASIVFMGRHDALTKLPNRVMFRECIDQAIAMADRGIKFAVICLDLDNFKQVNETLGHPVGDGLLVAAANRLQAFVREGDTVARLGGDEFAIIQLGIDDADDAEALASRIIEAFREPFEIGGQQIVAGMSVGITLATDAAVSYEGLIRDADIALYLAKTEGRGTARFFEPEMDARIHRRRALEQDLQGALVRGELELYYQPKINLTTNSISGFEALLRWHHPVRGFVSPMEFITLAEETGMIVAIGAWALQAACREAQGWPDNIGVAVNLSPVQFKKGELVANVQEALSASGLSPHRLELEITESIFLQETTATLNALRQLRAMGIAIALDDFGTGYSSLSYLHSFPFNKIKIDQSFVRNLMTNKGSMSIVRAIIGLGDSLGMITIAEGVETQEQLDILRKEGCSEVQGYFFSRPKPAKEVPLLIEQLQKIQECVNL